MNGDSYAPPKYIEESKNSPLKLGGGMNAMDKPKKQYNEWED
jgi:hypothetical protein